MKDIKTNVIDNSNLQNRIISICDSLASTVSLSMGPYGQNTIIQNLDNVYMSKDGWNIMERLNFGNTIDNSIAKLIKNVAHSVVLKVGDGTSTSVVVANELNKQIIKVREKFPRMTSRELENVLMEAVTIVCNNLKQNAVRITDDDKEEVIHKLAMVSTNWDEEISDIITQIYTKTDNPVIKIMNSGTDVTTLDIVEGYEISTDLIAPEYFINNKESEIPTCVIEDPMIVVFNRPIKDTDFLPLYTMASYIQSRFSTKLIVMSTQYENGYIVNVNNTANRLTKQHGGCMNLVSVKLIAPLDIDRQCIEDFVALIGGRQIGKTDDEFNSKYDELRESLNEINSNMNDPEKYQESLVKSQSVTEKLVDYIINELAGGCSTLTIKDKTSIVTGLDNINEELVNMRKTHLKSEIDKIVKDYDATTTLTENLRLKRIRLGKLNCHMGTIKVGGFGDAYLKAKRDAIDDAVKACESAYIYGYVTGGGIATIKSTPVQSNMEDELSAVLHAIRESFKMIFAVVLNNKINPNTIASIDIVNNGEYVDIFNQCVEEGKVYNVVTDQLDECIINPVNVDIEVLKGCLRMVLITVTSNQMIHSCYDEDID